MKILYADDEVSLQELMRIELPRRGHEVTVCPDGATAIAALEKNRYDCLLVDLDMPGFNGIEVIGKARELEMDAEAIILTGKSSLLTAIAAIRQGAFDYLTKPFKMADLEKVLHQVALRRELTHRCRVLARRLEQVEGHVQLVGSSPAMQRVRDLIGKVAGKHATVLIRGETGTGKELVARALHDQSLRATQPFVAVNCGALPETLIESELFGHCKGAFTGADQARIGLFEMAHGGTLFLDEIGELPKNMQAKLLRVLESGEMRRIGDREPTRVDVRIVCATHRDLEQMVHEGLFREDLLFRINTFEIHVPPLRERATDIAELAVHLLKRFLPSTALTYPAGTRADTFFAKEAIKHLHTHPWPGNVRELSNAIEHASILCDALPVQLQHLPVARDRTGSPQSVLGRLGPVSLHDLELWAIQASMTRHQGNRAKVADELGISVKTLYNRLVVDEDGAIKAA